MFKITALFKKLALVTLIFSIGLAAFPLIGVSAAGLNDQSTPPVNQPNDSRLERVWAREQTVYQREGNLLSKASGFINRAQSLIDKANLKGWDTSAVQAALNAFSSVIPAAQAAHDDGAAIVSGHAGFDANGNVTDRTIAIATAQALAQVLKDTRNALDGTGKALREAIKDFRQARRNNATPTP